MKEQAFLIGVSRQDNPLDELGRLAAALGYQVVGQIVSRSDEANPDSYFGPGLATKLRRSLDEGVTVIADSSLSPRQARTLSSLVGAEILDRTDIILRLFAARARTGAGKLQVELAQAEHDLARLRGRWTHLERQSGGRNKGAGEKQSEEDRRQLNKRIAFLRSKIVDLERQRESQRAERENSGLLRVALVGYTNAGKSTLLSALTGAETVSSPRPFETLDPLTRRFDTERGPVLVSDTVGFISQLPAELVAAFQATLDEVRGADLILHVADVADDNFWENRRVVLETLERLGVADRPRFDVLTHIDQTDKPIQMPGAYYLSSLTGEGIDRLKEGLVAYRDGQLEQIDIFIDNSDGPLLAEVARYDRGLRVSAENDKLHIKALLPLSVAQRLLGQPVPSMMHSSTS